MLENPRGSAGIRAGGGWILLVDSHYKPVVGVIAVGNNHRTRTNLACIGQSIGFGVAADIEVFSTANKEVNFDLDEKGQLLSANSGEEAPIIGAHTLTVNNVDNLDKGCLIGSVAEVNSITHSAK